MQEKNIKVSIITVCRNSENTIEKTITHVINQTYQNIEYIIIDGQSEDGTLGIIDNYRDHIRYIISEKDNGVYDAMNKGLKLASGELIGITNSDDWYEFDTIEKIVDFYEKSNGEIDFLYGNINVFYKEILLFKEEPRPKAFLCFMPAIPHPSVFIKGNIYKKYHFDTHYKAGADYDLILKLYKKKYVFKNTHLTLSNYRLGGFSESNALISFKESMIISLKNSNALSFLPILILKISLKLLSPFYRYHMMKNVKKSLKKYDDCAGFTPNLK